MYWRIKRRIKSTLYAKNEMCLRLSSGSSGGVVSRLLVGQALIEHDFASSRGVPLRISSEKPESAKVHESPFHQMCFSAGCNPKGAALFNRRLVI